MWETSFWWPVSNCLDDSWESRSAICYPPESAHVVKSPMSWESSNVMWRRADANSQRLLGHYQSRFLCGDDPSKSIVLIIETSFWSDCQALSFGSKGTPNMDVSGGLCYVPEHPSQRPREGFYIIYQHWVTKWQGSIFDYWLGDWWTEELCFRVIQGRVFPEWYVSEEGWCDIAFPQSLLWKCWLLLAGPLAVDVLIAASFPV